MGNLNAKDSQVLKREIGLWIEAGEAVGAAAGAGVRSII